MQLIINTYDLAPSEKQSSEGLSLDILGAEPRPEIKNDKNQKKFNPYASDDLQVRQRPMFQDLEMKNQTEAGAKKKTIQQQQFKQQYFKQGLFLNTQKILAKNKNQEEKFEPQMFNQAPFNNTDKLIVLQQVPEIQQKANKEEDIKKNLFMQYPFNQTEKILAEQELKPEQGNQNEQQNRVLAAAPLTNIQKQHIQLEVQQSNINIISPENAMQSKVVIDVTSQKARQEIKVDKFEEKPETEEELQPITVASDQASEKVNRVIGIIILVGMFLVLWIYGWASEYKVITTTSFPLSFSSTALYSSLFIMTAIFTVIGFGMLFIHFKKMAQSAIFLALFITSLSIIISPFIQKFWYNIFISNFNDTTITTANTSYLINVSMGGKNIIIDFYNMKFSLLSAISQMVALLGLFGKINFIQVTFFSIFYNLAWGLNHYLIISRLNSSPDTRIFDDYQIGSVYLFAGMFGLISSLIIKKPPLSEGFLHSNFSSMFAQIGTFFLFLSFCATTILFSQKSSSTSQARTLVWQQGTINTFFSLSASVTCTYLGSILLGGKIHVRQSIIGTVCGAIIFGSIAQICTNIGAAIACGCFSGLFSAFFYQKIYHRINRRQIYDSLGSILIAIISLISTLGVAPLIVYCYYKYNIFLPTLRNDANTANTAITSSQVISYMLQYVGITVGIGITSGIAVGLLMKIFDRFDANKMFEDKFYITKASGLKMAHQKQKNKQLSKSKQGQENTKQRVEIQPGESQKEIVPGS